MNNTINTGDVSRWMGIPVTAERLIDLGFKPAAKDKRAMLWDVKDFPQMCLALGDWITSRANEPMPDKPDAPPKKEKPAAAPAAPAGKAKDPDFDDEEEVL